MVIMLLVLFGAFVLPLLATVAAHLHKNNALPWQNKAKAIDSTAGMSWPAKQLVKEFNALPVDNRPAFDVYSIVRALDVKYMDNRYLKTHWKSYESGNNWSYCNCYRTCDFPEYVALHEQIESVARAIKERERALALSKVHHELNEFEALTEALGNEAKNINDVTKELV